MQQWRTRSREVILDERPWLSVERHTVEMPDGRVEANWTWVEMQDYVNVVAVTQDGSFLCFRQTKYALQEGTLGIVGGYLNDGEAPLDGAKRELREEMGYEAGEWIDLGRYCVDPNRGVATGHLFLARGARWVGRTSSDDVEPMDLVQLSPAEVQEALRAGEFKVLAWTAAIALSLLQLE